MSKNLIAKYDAVIVKPIKKSKKQGSIIVPDIDKQKNEIGEVIAVGPGTYTITGVRLEPETKVGDIVVLPTMGFTKLPYKGVEYYVGKEREILATIIKENE